MSMFFLSPDQVEALQAQRALSYLTVNAFLESLSSEDRTTLLSMLETALHHPEHGHKIAGHLLAMRRYKDGICDCMPEHGEHKITDHDSPDFLFQMGLDDSGSDTPPNEVGEPEEVMVKAVDHRGEEITLPMNHVLARYNLEWVEVSLSNDEVQRQLACAGCGQRYVSIQDRMLKKPGLEGCDTCMQNARWGGGKQPWDE